MDTRRRTAERPALTKCATHLGGKNYISREGAHGFQNAVKSRRDLGLKRYELERGRSC